MNGTLGREHYRPLLSPFCTSSLIYMAGFLLSIDQVLVQIIYVHRWRHRLRRTGICRSRPDRRAGGRFRCWCTPMLESANAVTADLQPFVVGLWLRLYDRCMASRWMVSGEHVLPDAHLVGCIDSLTMASQAVWMLWP